MAEPTQTGDRPRVSDVEAQRTTTAAGRGLSVLPRGGVSAWSPHDIAAARRIYEDTQGFTSLSPPDQVVMLARLLRERQVELDRARAQVSYLALCLVVSLVYASVMLAASVARALSK